MKLSKNTLYLGIIAYSLAILFFQDWGWMSATTGTTSALWLGKMVVDIGFAAIALVRLAGDSLFAENESDDEVAIHSEDLAVSDTMLFGLFMVNVAANTAFHGYRTVMATGAESIYFSFWFMGEIAVLFLSWVLFSHARKAQLRLARKSREAADARAATAASGGSSSRPRSVA